MVFAIWRLPSTNGLDKKRYSKNCYYRSLKAQTLFRFGLRLRVVVFKHILFGRYLRYLSLNFPASCILHLQTSGRASVVRAHRASSYQKRGSLSQVSSLCIHRVSFCLYSDHPLMKHSAGQVIKWKVSIQMQSFHISMCFNSCSIVLILSVSSL